MDAQRISRALEVWQLSGQTLSSWFAQSQERKSQTPALTIPILSLEPNDRHWLHQRIAMRFEQMINHGFLDEMHTLRQRSELNLSLPSMRCVGYRQAWEMMDQSNSELTPTQLEQLKELGIAATRQLAKRQITWLRSMSDRLIIECDQGNVNAKTLDLVNRLLAHPPQATAPTPGKSKTTPTE
jgi:tRNA dimethylallyltransferase